jgi:hypothetical protein
MGFLTAAQTAAIKSVRARAWNQPFQLQSYEAADVENMFDPLVTGPPTVTELLGDWVWGHQIDRRGRAGGVVEDAELLLACDIDHAPLFMAPGAARPRLLVPDAHGLQTLCEILSVTEYPGSGEVVVAASRIEKAP